MNRTILVGRLTKDPELRRTQAGKSVVSFTLAVNRQFKQEGQPDADFINCVAWNKTADLICTYLHKGSLAGVEGRIQTRSYDNQEGQRVYITEVICDNVQFIEPKSATEPQKQKNNINTLEQQRNAYSNDYATDTLDINSDDLPF